jgi:hypothetical protein
MAVHHVREDSGAQIVHPETALDVDGRPCLVMMQGVGSLDEFRRRLHFGYPEVGWYGDPRLELYHNGLTDRMELWRLAPDGERYRVCQGPPGGTLTGNIFRQLAERDMQRGFDAFAAAEAAEQKLIDQGVEADRQLREAAKEHLQWLATSRHSPISRGTN